ncbi:MAG: amidinotransferase [Candidatus Eiseniibacteriota bacterium]|nr:MAG: amidinotransferase [Candidatus Eisenbacteria bacterium]
MERKYGAQSMVAPLRRVLVRRPDESFSAADPDEWHYTSRPVLAEAQREHDALADILRKAGVEVIYHNAGLPGLADAMYVFDPVLVTDVGTVVLRMGKSMRRGEEAAMGNALKELGLPVLYSLHGDAVAEGGDLLWIDHDTLAVGLGFRTNLEGFRQLSEALSPLGVTLVPVELPYHKGPRCCLHLLSLVSIVDHDLALIYPPLLSATFWQYLEGRGFRFVHVPDEEFPTMGPNVLALAPGKCVMLEGNPGTLERLEAAGCEVTTYEGNEISLKAEGGPTCLTRPILREYE